MKMLPLVLLLILPIRPLAAETPHWRMDQAVRLAEWLEAADADGLSPSTAEAPALRAAIAAGDPRRLDESATAAAIHLVEAHRDGCCNAALRAGWHISNGLSALDPAAAVAAAVAQDRIDALFGSIRPSHPYYYALRRAYAIETEPARRVILAANLERWRWMPRQLAGRYLIVNTASFEATLWQDREQIGRWEVIVGKTKSATPVFAASITGVTFNPWWEIPSSIVAESVGALVRNQPAEAARRGYIVENGRYRQKPGANNALGRMKLVMPNPYNVYLHDTPSRKLFEQDIRTFSHGCVRVGDALGLATTLLSSLPGWDRRRVDQTVARDATKTITLREPVPVYVTYFTAETDGAGGIRYFADVYGRDKAAIQPSERCTR